MPTKRSVKYYESLKLQENSEKLENYKKKCRERVRNYRKRILESSKSEEFRIKTRNQVMKSRKRKMQQNSIGYSSSESLRKATKEVEKNLPEDYKKRAQIVQKLSQKFQLFDENDFKNELSELEDLIEDSTPVVKQMPGMKNFKLEEIEGGGRKDCKSAS